MRLMNRTNCNIDTFARILGYVILQTLVLQQSSSWRVSAFVFVTDGNGQLLKTASTAQTALLPPIKEIPFKTSEDDYDPSLSRRTLLKKIRTAPAAVITSTLVSSKHVCNAATSSKRNTDPEVAYSNLRKAREELAVAGRTYFPKRDWEGLREYLSNEDFYINNYDENANALLTSKRLDTESKQAIGTIRRYGVGADVIIMYGGLKAELSEENERPNSAEIEKYYIKTLDSLEEVIAIVRSNPGFSKIN
mmetsp:Transcript_5267/g.13290  ORF Transcript_5267/g.13290 Transcript_5267/m.13290 type:complete len:249 (-) Transcript_5267:69-815(-)